MESLVSIVIPVYNRSTLLERAVESVQQQTYCNWELLICDDASTDNTREIGLKLQQQDERIRILQNHANLGAAEARNTSMRAAKGKYIAFLDSDDEWMPQKLEKQIEVMESASSEIGICLTGARIIKNQNRIGYDIPLKEWEDETFIKFISGSIAFTTSTIVFRRSCLEKTGLMAPVLRRGQDVDLLHRIFYHYQLITIQEVLVTMHLVTLQKGTSKYDLIKYDYMMKNYFNTIEIEYGIKHARTFEGKLLSNIVTTTLREHKYLSAVCYMAKMFICTSLPNRRIILQISKAFLHGLWHWS